ncbi:MAG: hypothetical protein ACO2O5_14020, partial [Candidatus Caldipriscus sp.]
MVEVIRWLVERKDWYSLLPKGSYLVGGAIRDILLGRIPKDWDISVRKP